MFTSTSLKGSASMPSVIHAATTAISLTFSSTAPTLAQLAPGTYSGVATTTILYPNVYGTALQEQTIQTQVVCNVAGPARSNGGAIESNPFNLQIAPPNTAVGTQTGAISMWSAAVSGPGASNQLLVQYWNYKPVNATTYQGQLVNNGNSLSLAFNLVNFPYIIPPNLVVGGFPYSMANGTNITMAFSQGNRQLDVHIIGKTTDLARAFDSTIRCLR